MRTRSTTPERLDAGDLPYEIYERCLSDLSRVNVLTFTHRPMLRWLRRAAKDMKSFAVLDLACGHGDALRQIARWSRRAGKTPTLIGVDINPHATSAAKSASKAYPEIIFRTEDAFVHAPHPRPDFIITSQFAHHLDGDQVVSLLRWLETHAARGWFISDLHRHWLPHTVFPWMARAAGWHPIIASDGQISIARSFRAAEWRSLLSGADIDPGDAAIRWHIPFRLCVSRTCTTSPS